MSSVHNVAMSHMQFENEIGRGGPGLMAQVIVLPNNDTGWLAGWLALSCLKQTQQWSAVVKTLDHTKMLLIMQFNLATANLQCQKMLPANWGGCVKVLSHRRTGGGACGTPRGSGSVHEGKSDTPHCPSCMHPLCLRGFVPMHAGQMAVGWTLSHLPLSVCVLQFIFTVHLTQHSAGEMANKK